MFDRREGRSIHDWIEARESISDKAKKNRHAVVYDNLHAVVQSLPAVVDNDIGIPNMRFVPWCGHGKTIISVPVGQTVRVGPTPWNSVAPIQWRIAATGAGVNTANSAHAGDPYTSQGGSGISGVGYTNVTMEESGFGANSSAQFTGGAMSFKVHCAENTQAVAVCVGSNEVRGLGMTGPITTDSLQQIENGLGNGRHMFQLDAAVHTLGGLQQLKTGDVIVGTTNEATQVFYLPVVPTRYSLYHIVSGNVRAAQVSYCSAFLTGGLDAAGDILLGNNLYTSLVDRNCLTGGSIVPAGSYTFNQPPATPLNVLYQGNPFFTVGTAGNNQFVMGWRQDQSIRNIGTRTNGTTIFHIDVDYAPENNNPDYNTNVNCCFVPPITNVWASTWGRQLISLPGYNLMTSASEGYGQFECTSLLGTVIIEVEFKFFFQFAVQLTHPLFEQGVPPEFVRDMQGQYYHGNSSGTGPTLAHAIQSAHAGSLTIAKNAKSDEALTAKANMMIIMPDTHTMVKPTQGVGQVVTHDSVKSHSSWFEKVLNVGGSVVRGVGQGAKWLVSEAMQHAPQIAEAGLLYAGARYGGQAGAQAALQGVGMIENQRRAPPSSNYRTSTGQRYVVEEPD